MSITTSRLVLKKMAVNDAPRIYMGCYNNKMYSTPDCTYVCDVDSVDTD